jgi:hypothetical protein
MVSWGKCFLGKWVSEGIHSSSKVYLYLIIIGECFLKEDKDQRLLSKRQAVVWRNESKDKQRTGHRKVGQYHTGLHLSVFMTR